MPIIPIELARVGMKLDKDIHSGSGLKLAVRGMVLTQNQIRVLMKYNVKTLEVEAAETPPVAASVPAAPIGGKRKEAVSHLLRGIPMFEIFNDEQLDLLMANFTIVNHGAREVLFREGDPGDSFFVVLKGAIKIYMHNKEGREKTLSVCRPGDSFGELSLLDGKPRSASAQTLKKTELLVISHNDFMKLLEGHFEITHTIMRDIIARIRDTHQHMRDLTVFDARTRVMTSLINMANRYGRRTSHAIEVELPLDPNELAQMVGVKPGELQLVLNDLEERDLIRMNAGNFVLNIEKLRANR
ncbi:cyclic nucleotide-binding domain-containing protein [Cohnella sp. CFH 77786]|uniref:Crp/Fnr family transcriptional regulator n=1 Tax=Cohnella sp. CFH 77786 TaxID=2662265 RepID=UPI001C60C975|nr:Crp/Fnr family transcriptional regulator [Cohnella sp. CFH 77786]MBW5448009.1 cyclic nucleotide-binding domain-containing protein [Cohnella sp. CFH 77786]